MHGSLNFPLKHFPWLLLFCILLKVLNTKNKTLFVVSEDSVNYEALLSMSNLQNVLVLFADEINVYDVVNSDSVVMTLDAMKSIEEVLA